MDGLRNQISWIQAKDCSISYSLLDLQHVLAVSLMLPPSTAQVSKKLSPKFSSLLAQIQVRGFKNIPRHTPNMKSLNKRREIQSE